MTKRFIELGSTHIKDNSTGDEYYAPCEHKLCDLLNELSEENEQLKKEVESWKFNCLSTMGENSILWNEIAIMREQGAKPSSAFEKYCSKFKGDVE